MDGHDRQQSHTRTEFQARAYLSGGAIILHPVDGDQYERAKEMLLAFRAERKPHVRTLNVTIEREDK
jgi:hypothetical protein